MRTAIARQPAAEKRPRATSPRRTAARHGAPALKFCKTKPSAILAHNRAPAQNEPNRCPKKSQNVPNPQLVSPARRRETKPASLLAPFLASWSLGVHLLRIPHPHPPKSLDAPIPSAVLWRGCGPQCAAVFFGGRPPVRYAVSPGLREGAGLAVRALIPAVGWLWGWLLGVDLGESVMSKGWLIAAIVGVAAGAQAPTRIPTMAAIPNSRIRLVLRFIGLLLQR